MPFNQELNCALSAACQAGEIQQAALAAGSICSELKGDLSPVTAVDRACEHAIFTALRTAFPADGFLGEETGASPGTTWRTWIVDPIDGTRPYIHGIATYSTLIALEDAQGIAVGVMHFAGLGETYWATRGGGAFANGTTINVSSTHEPNRIFGSALGFVEQANTPEGRALFQFMRTWDYAYGFMDAYSYALLACGKIDLCVNLLDKPWDCAAAACIVTEAGGCYSDICGATTVHNGSIILANSALHQTAVNYFTQSLSGE